jgi:hypothetical protein
MQPSWDPYTCAHACTHVHSHTDSAMLKRKQVCICLLWEGGVF